jgi:predicted MPP superfamily phosphohydrolase
MERESPDFKEEQARKSKRRREKESTPRRSWLKKIIVAALGLIGGIAYLRFESNWLETTKKTVALPKFPKGRKIRILHLSDLHLSQVVSIDDLDSALNRGLREQPDVMMITGDFITGELPAESFRELAECLGKYASQVPTFACLGNHDGGAWLKKRGGYEKPNLVKAMLKLAKIKLLENSSQSIFIKGQPLVLSGVGDYWSEACQPKACLRSLEARSKPSKEITILLCHNPDAKELLKGYEWDLMLSGHTHGGQFKIPFLDYAPFAPVMDRSMTEGLHDWEGRKIHVTRGVGNLYGIRLNCRPEISLLEIVST